MNFKHKVALVTGSSKGIGKATIIKFAQLGCNVVINYNTSKKETLDFKKLIEATYPIKVLAIKADISIEEEVKKMVDTVIKEFNHIDILVNNAGIAIDTTLEDKTEDIFRKVINVNLVGTFLVTKYVSKYMLQQKQGKIINVSSTNGIDTYYPYSIDYDASKAGVISLTNNFSKLLAPYINVNCICPGWVNTDMTKDLDNPFRMQEISKINLKRFAEPEEIARVIVFLASDNASYVNNAIIRVDGGY